MAVAPPPPATDPGPRPADPGELGQVRAAIAADQPAPSLPVEVHDGRTDPPPGGDDDEGLRPDEIEALERRILDLTEEDLADLWELAFGLPADTSGKEYWELSEKKARRLGHWSKKVLDRHPEVLSWLKDWFPELVLSGIFSYEVWTRWRIGKKREAEAAEKKRGGDGAPTP